MPKSLVLGNGSLLIGLDKYAQVRDFYYPFVGLENQVGGHYVHRIGVYVENQISWIDSGEWQVEVNYAEETLVSNIRAVNERLGIELRFADTVYNETNIFLRQVEVKNHSQNPRQIKLFFHQEFEIYESHRGDTAYFDPIKNVVIHYKGRRVFLVNGFIDNTAQTEPNKTFDDFSIGIFNIEGREGTYKDAEDGYLEKNPIEHGLVDSVIGFTLDLAADQSQLVYYWLIAAKLVKEAHQLNDYVLTKTPQHLIKTTQDFWRAWVNKETFKFTGLDDSVVRLFKKSLLIIRTHVDNKGAIIASGDSDMLQHGRDTYSYMWPRDGAYVTLALDKAGDSGVARRFFEFCNQVITDEGYFMHKYRADLSPGSSWHPWVRDGKPQLPIQEDETALVIFALWDHFQVSKDLEFIESIYNSLIRKATEFMIAYRDEETGLPKASYDLWEEKFGIHTFTACSVYGALLAATRFANLLGKTEAQEYYYKVAKSLKEAILKHLFNPQDGTFYKMINRRGDLLEADPTLDFSSVYGIYKFGVLDVDDERLKKAFAIFADRLSSKTEVNGIARYEGDQYYRVYGDVPGNPWFITTLWNTQFKIASAKKVEDLEVVKEDLIWVFKHAKPSGMLSEQLNPFTGDHISATPLSWSHGEYVLTVIQYLDKIKELEQPAASTDSS